MDENKVVYHYERGCFSGSRSSSVKGDFKIFHKAVLYQLGNALYSVKPGFLIIALCVCVILFNE